uniref:GTPase IMAP family member 8 n=1 Tax=Oncorhynchus tshawytscha TaxID=74940 RepID=A0A8C8MA21_ONCTS
QVEKNVVGKIHSRLHHVVTSILKWDGYGSVRILGNMILQQGAFPGIGLSAGLFGKKQQCESASGKVNGKSVTVVKSPDFFALSVESLMQEMEKCMSLSAPGPHGILLVLKPEEFTEENRNTFKLILSIFGKEAFKHSMVIITHEGVTGNPHLRQMIKDCGGRHHEMYKQGSAEMECSSTECIRVVLIGKTGNGKSASANTILGREEFKSESSTDSVTTVCKKAVGKVDGRPVSVVDTPGLFDTTLSNKDVQQEIVKCVSLSAPGPHVFIIVLSIGRMTQEELDTLDLIETTFGPRAGMFCLVLFSRGDDLGTMLIQDYIVKSKSDKLKKLIRDCGWRFHVFNNKDKNNRTQVTELIKKINEMVSMNKGSFYTNEMFQEAETCEQYKEEKEILMQKHKKETDELTGQYGHNEKELTDKMKELEIKHKEEIENMTTVMGIGKQVVNKCTMQ